MIIPALLTEAAGLQACNIPWTVVPTTAHRTETANLKTITAHSIVTAIIGFMEAMIVAV